MIMLAFSNIMSLVVFVGTFVRIWTRANSNGGGFKCDIYGSQGAWGSILDFLLYGSGHGILDLVYSVVYKQSRKIHIV